jgi:hypothetical protein
LYNTRKENKNYEYSTKKEEFLSVFKKLPIKKQEEIIDFT